MSTISSSTDGGYQYYSKRLGELEDDLNTEIRRSRDSYEKRANDLKKGYSASVDQTSRDAERAVEESSQKSAEQLQKERTTARTDVEEARRQLYDRYGKLNQETSARRKDDNDHIEQLSRQYQDDLKKATDGAIQSQTERDLAFANREEHDASNLSSPARARPTSFATRSRRCWTARSSGTRKRGRRSSRPGRTWSTRAARATAISRRTSPPRSAASSVTPKASANPC